MRRSFVILLFVLANVANTWSQSQSETWNASSEYGITQSNIHEKRFEADGKNGEFKRKWITQLFAEAKRTFDMTSSVNDACARDFSSFRDHLIHNQTIWAVRMHEASEWPVVGILAGITEHLGHFVECVDIQRPEFSGKYCLAKAEVTFSVNEGECILSKGSNQISPECSAWSFLEMCNHNPYRVIRNKISWAMCIPSSCTAHDLETSLVHTLNPIFERNLVNISVNVHPLLCQAKEKTARYSPWYSFTKWLLCFLIALVVFATIYDCIFPESTCTNARPLMKLFTSFSAVRTCKNIVAYEPSTTFPSIYMLKTMAVILVLIAHRWMLTMRFPLFQIEDLEAGTLLFTMNKINIVDVFFMISGFLMYYHAINPLKEWGGAYIVLHVLLRYSKIIRTYGIILLFGVNILPILGDGPLWILCLKNMFGACPSNWWQNILCINNYQAGSKKCYLPTWYLAVDVQLSILAGLLLLLLTKNEKRGRIAMVLTFAAGSLIPSIVARYSMNFNGFFVFTLRTVKNFRNEFTQYYTATYPRISPYLFGLFIGMLVVKLKQKKILFSQFQAIILLSTSTAMTWAVSNFGTKTESPDHIPCTIDLIFGAVYRPIFISPFAAFVCISTTGISNLGILKPIFRVTEWKGFIPLGRLAFCQFLVGPMFQLYQIYTQRSSIRSSNLILDFVLWALTDYVFTLAFAFVLHLISQGPVLNFHPTFKKKIISVIFKNPEKENNVEDKKID